MPVAWALQRQQGTWGVGPMLLPCCQCGCGAACDVLILGQDGWQDVKVKGFFDQHAGLGMYKMH